MYVRSQKEFSTAATERLAPSGVGRPESSPDLLELALFNGIGKPAPESGA
ncbi:hypothetical protein [Streptomyces sp. NPDC012510]